MSLEKQNGAMFRPSKKGRADLRQEDVEEAVDDNSKHDKQEREAFVPSNSPPSRSILLLSMLGVILLISRASSRGGRVVLLIIAVPILLVASVASGSWKVQPHQRLIALGFVGSIAGNQFPHFVSAGLAAVALTAFSLSTRLLETNESTEAAASQRAAHVRAVCAALFLVVVLLMDNFFVWVVSATYYPSHSGLPTPLQDNGRLMVQHFFEQMLDMKRNDVQQIRATVNVQWALVAALAAAFVVCELQWVQKRTLYGVVTRTIFTLACARFIRVVSFLLTVLPSQMPNCYRGHFPNPPPQDWWSWLQVGFLPSTSGGCNDLIVSGHATVTSVFACVSTSVAGHWAFSIAVWSMLAIDFMIEVYEGYHYSVDMWMGALFTVMLWRILAPLQAMEERIPKREFQTTATAQDIFLYTTPLVGAYLILIFSPQSIANFWIVLYLVAAIAQSVRNGINHYVQHLLFCVLFLALALYL
jgi:hypothetical protein